MRKAYLVSTLMAGIIGFGMALPSQAANDEVAKGLLQKMSNYLVDQKKITFTYDLTLEIVTDELQKLRFTSSGTLNLSRPDKLRMTRTGGFADVEMTYDGDTLSAKGKYENVYTQLSTKGTIDDLIETLRFDYGLQIPAADLLSTKPYEILMSNVTDVKYLGTGFVGGRECEHLAFRTNETDWEIWINQDGQMPYPCQFSITSKMMTLAPSYTIQVKDWKAGDAVAADDFKLNIGDAKKVDISELKALDEVPSQLEKGNVQ